MSATVEKLLESFDALTDPEKREAAIEIMRRVSAVDANDLPEEAFVGAADELFRALDAEEAADGKP